MDALFEKKRGLKTAIGLAIALALMGGGWLYYAKSEEITLPLSCRFVKIPENLIIVGEHPKIDVKVRAPARLVQKLKEPLVYEVHLPKLEPGRHVVTLSTKDIPVSQGAKILEINPTSFTIHVDTRSEKSVPVVPDLINTPVPGYVVTIVETTPSTVHLVGPASLIEKISAIRTTPVDLSGMQGALKKTVALNLRDGLSVRPEENRLVTINIEIQEEVIDRALSLPVRCLPNENRCVIRPERINVVVRGPKNTINKLSQDSGIKVSVDLKGLAPGVYSRPAVIEPPLNTTIVKAEPMVFTIEVFK